MNETIKGNDYYNSLINLVKHELIGTQTQPSLAYITEIFVKNKSFKLFSKSLCAIWDIIL